MTVEPAQPWVIVQLCMAGVPSTFSASSAARTRKLCAPGARFEYAFGDVHGAKAALSSEHSNVEAPSLEVKLKVAPVDVPVAGGAPAPMVVCGAVVSIRQLKVAGDASTFPAASFARARNSCWPSARPV